MSYTVMAGSQVDFAPEDTVHEVLQNVRTIITTRKGTVPLDRDFGLDIGVLDKPLPVAMGQLQSAIVQALAEYEPRAKLLKVSFETDADGAIEGFLKPIVTIDVEES